jgi:hypothetical protein
VLVEGRGNRSLSQAQKEEFVRYLGVMGVGLYGLRTLENVGQTPDSSGPCADGNDATGDASVVRRIN